MQAIRVIWIFSWLARCTPQEPLELGNTGATQGIDVNNITTHLSDEFEKYDRDEIPTGFVKETRYKHLQKKLDAAKRSLQDERATQAATQSSQAAFDSAVKATDEVASLIAARKRGQARVERQMTRDATHLLRREQRTAPALDQPLEGFTSPAIQKVAKDLKQRKLTVTAAQKLFKKRSAEIQQKKKSAKSSRMVDALDAQLEKITTLSMQKVAKAKSEVIKGKQRLARAEARNMANQTGDFKAVLGIYTKRVKLQESRLQDNRQKLTIAQQRQQRAQHDVDKARQQEAGLEAARQELVQARQAVVKLSRQIQTDKSHLKIDQDRVKQYGAMNSTKSNVERTPTVVSDSTIGRLNKRIAALGSASADSDRSQDATIHSPPLRAMLDKSLQNAAKTRAALADSISNKKMKEVGLLTRRLETQIFEQKLRNLQMPTTFDAELESVASVLKQAHDSESEFAENRALIRAAVANPAAAKFFPDQKAYEKAATQMGISSLFNNNKMQNITNNTNQPFQTSSSNDTMQPLQKNGSNETSINMVLPLRSNSSNDTASKSGKSGSGSLITDMISRKAKEDAQKKTQDVIENAKLVSPYGDGNKSTNSSGMSDSH